LAAASLVPFFAVSFSPAARDCGDEEPVRFWGDDAREGVEDDARDCADDGDALLAFLVSAVFVSSVLRADLDDVPLEVDFLVPADFDPVLPFFSAIDLLPQIVWFCVAWTGARKRLPRR
jgi:hypothetical protein